MHIYMYIQIFIYMCIYIYIQGPTVVFSKQVELDVKHDKELDNTRLSS